MVKSFVRDIMQSPAGVAQSPRLPRRVLLEHVVTLMDAADRMLRASTRISIATAPYWEFSFTNIGKLRELSYRKVFAYTDEASSLGHLINRAWRCSTRRSPRCPT